MPGRHSSCRAALSEQYGNDKLHQLKQIRRGTAQPAQFNNDGVGNPSSASLYATPPPTRLPA